MRRRRLVYALLGFLIPLAVLLIVAAWPGSSTFTISEETTYITEPVDEDGYPDYEAALNDRIGKGITPEDNANVLIWRAFGPRPEGGKPMPAEFFRRLGIVEPPEQGDYFIGLRAYLRDQLKLENEQIAAIDDQLSEAIGRPWASQDHPEIAGWLKANEKPLRLVSAATKRPEYYNPLVTSDKSGLLGARIPSVQTCRASTSAFAARAMLRIEERNFEGAWQDLLACHRLGRLLGRGATLIELLVGIAADAIASKADVAFVERAPLTSKQLLACLQDLRILPPMPALADKIDLLERYWLLEAILLAARHGPEYLETLSGGIGPPSREQHLGRRLFTRSIDWDPALRNANRWIDRCVASLRLPDRSARLNEMAEFSRDWQTLKSEVAAMDWAQKLVMGPERRGEMIGNVLIGLMLPSFEKVHSAAERCEQTQRNLRIAFALAASQRDHGRYPAKLDELAPRYLEKIPDDLFAGGPLKYQPTDNGFMLYSVGVNGTDDGGRGYDDDPPGDDLCIRIPTPAPKGK
jgi:hypothetical protein